MGRRSPSGVPIITGPEGTLTARELAVLELLAQGKTNREIAACLYITLATVKAHVGSILHKLAVRSRTAAVVHYLNARHVEGR